MVKCIQLQEILIEKRTIFFAPHDIMYRNAGNKLKNYKMFSPPTGGV
jgi:hypothetical protein